MWDLPRPGLETMSPALAGGSLTTAPPGKASLWFPREPVQSSWGHQLQLVLLAHNYSLGKESLINNAQVKQKHLICFWQETPLMAKSRSNELCCITWRQRITAAFQGQMVLHFWKASQVCSATILTDAANQPTHTYWGPTRCMALL